MADTMKVMKGKLLKRVPMAFLEPHREQAMSNHGQTLERLNERGGLSAWKMLAVAYDVDFHRINPHIDHEEHLGALLKIWEMGQSDGHPPDISATGGSDD